MKNLIFLFSLLLSMGSISLSAQSEIEFDWISYLQNQHPQVPDSTLLKTLQDSSALMLGSEPGTSVVGASALTSPDGSFRLFQMEFEGCGAYCNPFFETALVEWNEKEEAWKVAPLTDDLERVNRILPLEEPGQYLFFGTSYGRPRGVESVYCNWLRWYKSGGNADLPGMEMLWGFSSCTSTLVESDEEVAELNYDEKSRILSYRFQWYEEFNDLKPYEESGQYQFDGKEFKLILENKTYDLK